jgi:hypothetical protein
MVNIGSSSANSTFWEWHRRTVAYSKVFARKYLLFGDLRQGVLCLKSKIKDGDLILSRKERPVSQL